MTIALYRYQAWRCNRYQDFSSAFQLEELETDTTRGISSTDVADVASGSYIRDGRTIIINGPTGTGKSYLACAFGEHACR